MLSYNAEKLQLKFLGILLLICFTSSSFLYIVDRDKSVSAGNWQRPRSPIRLNGRPGSESLLFISNTGTKNNAAPHFLFIILSHISSTNVFYCSYYNKPVNIFYLYVPNITLFSFINRFLQLIKHSFYTNRNWYIKNKVKKCLVFVKPSQLPVLCFKVFIWFQSGKRGY